MAISPILMSGVVQRADDVGALKNQQDSRPVVEQQNAQAQMSKKVEAQRQQVQKKEDSDKADTHADAREKGKNSYFFRKKDKSKKQEEIKEDRVVKKTTGGFDIKI
ncbi:MAG: hypothetical protein IJ958_06065 [Agathobacter sp.]|nr:hypothetical protein [Agathobacter sp.]